MTFTPMILTLPMIVLSVALIQPHVFPAGHVERSLQVIVRDQTLHLEYSVGMSDATLQAMIANWKSVTPKPTTDLLRKLALRPDVNESDAVGETDSPQRSEADQNDDEFDNEATLLAEFQQRAPEFLAQNLTVTVDGVKIPLTASSEPPATRRHMSLTLNFTAPLPARKRLDLVVSEQNFSHSGGVRLAMKTTGDAILAQTNVAPILVRAETINLDNLNEAERINVTTIRGTIFSP